MGKHGPGTALITSASSGIGETFARKLASQGYDLVLVARRKERLDAIAGDLEEKHPVMVEVLPGDLSKDDNISRIEQRIEALDTLTMLVNNAGFGTRGAFADVDLEKSLAMIQVHVIASTRFARAALPRMIDRRKGTIINVASPSAFIPFSGNTVYSATKAYLITFSECLQLEVADAGIKVQALCPGLTYTEFHDTDEFQEMDQSRFPGFMWMSAKEAVEQSLNALNNGKGVFVPGFANRLMYVTFRRITTRLAAKVLR
ncbi:MAG: SDR family oxidoreductase [Anaerolineae bacterium]|nr:SDR family oxidoreductase [Anaerolineae bacterium]